tara:strand:- start:42 stop:626 length:585 start_codon:yes stop_codon:yes gene_type:complete
LPENELGEYQMNCMICHLDKKKHSKELWKLHQQHKLCMFCSKNGSEHSEELWEMHKAAVEKGQFCIDHKKKEKLYPITIGFSRKGIARVCRINADPPHDVDFVPIYMSCTECGLYLGSDEEDYADMLGGMCFSCFRKLIGQTDSWYDKPSTEYTRLYTTAQDDDTKRNSDQTKIDRKSKINTLNTIPEKRRGRK